MDGKSNKVSTADSWIRRSLIDAVSNRTNPEGAQGACSTLGSITDSFARQMWQPLEKPPSRYVRDDVDGMDALRS
jgi:hypothetical protein